MSTGYVISILLITEIGIQKKKKNPTGKGIL